MFKAIKPFVDGEDGIPWAPEDGGHTYAVGDVYPKNDFKPTEEHIAYLKGDANTYGEAVIEGIEPQIEPGSPEAKPQKVEKKSTKGK